MGLKDLKGVPRYPPVFLGVGVGGAMTISYTNGQIAAKVI
jgi:hypothetical protein